MDGDVCMNSLRFISTQTEKKNIGENKVFRSLCIHSEMEHEHS